MELEEGESGPGNPAFAVSATTNGLTVELPAEMRKPGWFAVPPPPHKVADAGWQKGCAVRYVCSCSLQQQHCSPTFVNHYLAAGILRHTNDGHVHIRETL